MCSISNLVRFSTLFVLFAFVVAVSDSHWWYSPCTSDLIRHTRNTAGALVEVRRQLRIFIKELDFGINRLNKLYRHQPTVKPLGKSGCLRFARMAKEMKAQKRHNKNILQKFYTFLQHIASVIQLLSNREIDMEAEHLFDKDERKSVYIKITFQMRSLLCEVSDSSTSRLKNIVVKNDRFRQCTYSDLNFFRKLKHFFKVCQKLIR